MDGLPSESRQAAEMYKDVSAWQEWPVGLSTSIRQQRTRSDINGVGVANQSAMKSLTRKFIEGQGGWRTGARGTGDTREPRHTAGALNGGDVKSSLGWCAGPCIDESSDVRTTGG